MAVIHMDNGELANATKGRSFSRHAFGLHQCGVAPGVDQQLLAATACLPKKIFHLFFLMQISKQMDRWKRMTNAFSVFQANSLLPTPIILAIGCDHECKGAHSPATQIMTDNSVFSFFSE